MIKSPSTIIINAGATATLRIKVKSFIDDLEKVIATPTSVRGYSIYLHLLDDAGNRRWGCKLDDKKWDYSEKLFKIELSSLDTIKLAGYMLHFEASMSDSEGHVIISNLIKTPDTLLKINENQIGTWMSKELSAGR